LLFLEVTEYQQRPSKDHEFTRNSSSIEGITGFKITGFKKKELSEQKPFASIINDVPHRGVCKKLGVDDRKFTIVTVS
jgi:hypothetical protein